MLAATEDLSYFIFTRTYQQSRVQAKVRTYEHMIRLLVFASPKYYYTISYKGKIVVELNICAESETNCATGESCPDEDAAATGVAIAVNHRVVQFCGVVCGTSTTPRVSVIISRCLPK